MQNFRCFADCDLDLHPELTVLVAENGRGKTAVLDAIGIALGPYIDVLAGAKQARRLSLADVRLVRGQDGVMRPSLPTAFTAEGLVDGNELLWSSSLRQAKPRSRATKKKTEALRNLAQKVRERVTVSAVQDAEPPTLPIVAFYSTGRLWSEGRSANVPSRYGEITHSRFSGYADCLSTSSSFNGMVTWYENKMNETRDPRFSGELQQTLPLIASVQEATRAVLQPSGWCELSWDFEKRTLVVGHQDHGLLPLSMLSDGVRNMVALIADIARRCAALNPHLNNEAAKRTPGVVLIDEVDMHLHPRWQQLVIGLLRSAFPSMQMIVSTHSPHVLSTVDAESIRVIRLSDGHGVIDLPTFQTRGIESADILAKVMDVDPVPQVEQSEWLSDYRALIQTGEYESVGGRQLWERLVGHFGSEHPVLIEAAALRRLQEFKQSHRIETEGRGG